MNALARRLGPLPAWAWLAFAAVAGVVYLRSRGSSSTPTSPAGDAGTPQLVAGDTSSSADTGAAGISPLDLAALLQGELSPFQQLLNTIYSGGQGSGSMQQAASSQGASTGFESQAGGTASPFVSQTQGFSSTGGSSSTPASSGVQGFQSPTSQLGPGAVDVGGGGSLAGVTSSTGIGTAVASSGSVAPPPALGHGAVFTG